ncbi:hypothetical protein JCM10213_003794 [Rhodosporidiobolus nylandii]
MPAPIRLSVEPSPLAQSLAKLKRVKSARECWRWSGKSFRLARLPLRIRPAFILYTFLTLLLLSLLGFHPTLASHVAPPAIPFSDKALHFVCFWAATTLFYAIWVVEEHARRWWVWAWFNEIVSVGVCVFAGGILSEIVQSFLPYKTFQPGDILANLLGSSLGVFLSSRLASRARRDAELRRLYSHLGEMSDSDDEGEGEGEELLAGGAGSAEREMEEGRVRAEGQLGAQGGARERGGGSSRRQAQDPWDAGVGEEEIFGLGGDDDDDEPRRGEKGPL